MGTKAVVRTPGGRVGNDRTTGSRSNGENWVERSPKGRLPRYIRIVRNGLMKNGHSESRATALAVAAMKRWARGGDNVRPKVQAAAAAALAEWEAMKAGKSDDIELSTTEDGTGRARMQRDHEQWDQTKAESAGDDMQIEHKTVGVNGLKVLNDDDGIIETYVSVTGIVDNVKDVIEPGAYAKTLAVRTPKGVWSHDWDTPISKTIGVKELLPGDEDLPETLPNGDKWPSEAGALKVKTQFNLETQRGREAYSDVKFFGTDQEWSIGYNVPTGGAIIDSKAGVRRIKSLDLYEYSPVLFGAMPAARSASVKEAQIAYKMLKGDDINQFLTEAKSLISESRDLTEDVDGVPDDLDEPLNFNTSDTKALLSAENVGILKKAISALNDLLNAATSTPDEDTTEEKVMQTFEASLDHKGLGDILETYRESLDEKTAETLAEHVDSFDSAVELDDAAGIEEHSVALLDIIDDEIDTADDEGTDALKSLAQGIHDIITKVMDEGDDEDEEYDEDEDEDEDDDNDTEGEGEKVVFDTTEIKSLRAFLDGLK